MEPLLLKLAITIHIFIISRPILTPAARRITCPLMAMFGEEMYEVEIELEDYPLIVELL